MFEILMIFMMLKVIADKSNDIKSNGTRSEYGHKMIYLAFCGVV